MSWHWDSPKVPISFPITVPSLQLFFHVLNRDLWIESPQATLSLSLDDPVDTPCSMTSEMLLTRCICKMRWYRRQNG